MSEKNPKMVKTLCRKKIRENAEKNPTDHSTNLHPPTNDSSSSLSPPIHVVDPYANLPDVDGLSRSIIIAEVEAIAKERGGDFEKYRDSLVKEILSGNGRTMTNIRIRRSRIRKRERGEQIQAALQAHGFVNTFDFYEKDLG